MRGGKILSRGFHRAFGEPHAEVDALSKLPLRAAEGATLYVNLEPCCHHGKTPPCTEAITRAGVQRVVYGLADPNPQVNKQGLDQLTKAGVKVHGPVLESDCREINRGYLKHRQTGLPWVTLKWAQSLDGRIATFTGDSRWISGPESLKLAHVLRAEHDAVLAGINTVLTDDPQLTVRHIRGHHPTRVILDSALRFPTKAAMLTDGKARILIATSQSAPEDKIRALKILGAEVLTVPGERGQLDLNALLKELGQRGILYLLVEGGSKVIASFIQQGLFDEIVCIIAPSLIGADGIASTGAFAVARMDNVVKLQTVQRKAFGRDIVVWLRPQLRTTNDQRLCSPA